MKVPQDINKIFYFVRILIASKARLNTDIIQKNV